MIYRNYNNNGNYFWICILLFVMFGGIRTVILFIPVIFSLLPIIVTAFIFLNIFKGINKNNKLHEHVKINHKERSRFMELLIHILIKAVKADGKVDEREIVIIKQFFKVNLRLSDMDMLWVNDLVKHALKSNIELKELCLEFSQFDPQAKLILLELTYQVMVADNVISRAEIKFIDQIVQYLNISYTDHQRIKSHYSSFTSGASADHSSHYEVLGVKPDANSDEIKKAYKQACKKYHPDKVQYLGDEFKKVAEERIKKINQAYAVLKR